MQTSVTQGLQFKTVSDPEVAYHRTAGIGGYHRESFDCKPQPGMFQKARDDLGLDMAGSVLVGDKESDMEDGRAAGVGTLIRLAADDSQAMRGGKCDVLVLKSLAAVRCRLGQARTLVPEARQR